MSWNESLERETFDSLTHVTPSGSWFGSDVDASERELLRQMDDARVQRAMLVGLAEHIENSFVLDVCHRHPDRLVPCASFNPRSGVSAADVRARLRGEFKNGPYKAIKLHPRLNRYDPLDPSCLAVLEEIASWEYPLPVFLDTLFYYRGGLLRKGPVDTIHELVGQFPSVTFVLLHGGGSWVLQVAESIRDCPNAFLDLSFTLQRYRSTSLAADLRHLICTFDRRIVFGSDFPEIGIRAALETFYDLTQGLPAEKLANVLDTNLARILGLGHL